MKFELQRKSVEEIENIVDSIRRTHLSERKPFTRIDVELLIPKIFPDESVVLDLDYLDSKVLGRTMIDKFGKAIITINGRLYENTVTSRVQHTMGHELGHYLLHKDILILARKSGLAMAHLENEIAMDRFRFLEREADRFAGALRVPRNEIIYLFEKLGSRYIPKRPKVNIAVFRDMGILQSREKLLEWARLYGVSLQSISLRLRDLDILNMNGLPLIGKDNKFNYNL